MLISIVYHSGYGHTAKVAELVAEGGRRAENVNVELVSVGDGDIPWEKLEASDAIIFGSPTYNGLISAKFKQFMEESTKTAWFEQKWRNKIAAGFTNSGAQHGDKLNSLISLSLFAAQHGMIWVGLDLMPGNSDSKGTVEDLNRHGSWLGVMTQSNNDQSASETPNSSDLKTAAYLGERVAKITQRFLSGDN